MPRARQTPARTAPTERAAPKATADGTAQNSISRGLANCGTGGDRVERFAEANPGSGENIAIPGYESLSFKAGSQSQNSSFHLLSFLNSPGRYTSVGGVLFELHWLNVKMYFSVYRV